MNESIDTDFLGLSLGLSNCVLQREIACTLIVDYLPNTSHYRLLTRG